MKLITSRRCPAIHLTWLHLLGCVSILVILFSTVHSQSEEHELQILYDFEGPSDGQNPQSGLIIGSDHRVYGTTYSGGKAGDGTIFSMSQSGTNYTVLAHMNLPTDGGKPLGRILDASDGRIYATTSEGGANGRGTIVSVLPNGSDFRVEIHLFINENL
jgi:uncharacterized repeat protein (TIGR03803 family)